MFYALVSSVYLLSRLSSFHEIKKNDYDDSESMNLYLFPRYTCIHALLHMIGIVN